MVFSLFSNKICIGIQLGFPNKICIHYIQLYIAVGRIILQRGSWLLAYLIYSIILLRFFLYILENKNLFQILGITGSCIEGA